MAEVWQADLFCEPEAETDEFGRRSSLLLKLEDPKLYSPEFERFFDKGEEYSFHPSMGDVKMFFFMLFDISVFYIGAFAFGLFCDL